jgi:hypothetical protein
MWCMEQQSPWEHHGSRKVWTFLFYYLCVETWEHRRVLSAASATIGRQRVQRAAGCVYVRVWPSSSSDGLIWWGIGDAYGEWRLVNGDYIADRLRGAVRKIVGTAHVLSLDRAGVGNLAEPASWVFWPSRYFLQSALSLFFCNGLWEFN